MYAEPTQSYIKMLIYNQEPLYCALVEISDGSSQAYEALSYTWTESDDHAPRSEKIRCDDGNILITAHLASALLQMRYTSQTRILWIDQVCIDQGNKSEKDTQIPLMGQVYSMAAHVLVWIGLGDVDSNHAMDSLPGLIRDLEGLDNDIKGPFKILCEDGSLGVPHSKALNRLLKQRWFSRVWTLQEAALGLSCWLLCGDRHIGFRLLLTLRDRSQTDTQGHWKETVNTIAVAHTPERYNERYVTQHIHAIAKLKESRSSGTPANKEEPLFMLVSRVRSCNCTKDKDRIYGLYEFLPAGIKHYLEKGLKPSEHTVKSLYLELATIEIVKCRQPVLLSVAGTARQKLKLPSWVPDWTYVAKQHSFAVINQDTKSKGYETMYDAGRYSGEINPRSDGNVLHVQGKVVASIIGIGDPFQFAISTTRGSADYSAKLEELKSLLSERLEQINACLALAKRHEPLDTGLDTSMACYCTLFTGVKALGGGSTVAVHVLASDEDIRQHVKAITDFSNTCTNPAAAAQNQVDLQNQLAEFRTSGLSWQDFMVRLKQELADHGKRIRNQAGGAVELIQDACKGRVFCIFEHLVSTEQEESALKRRYVGLAPEGAETGDIVSVIYGCPAPMLLRKSKCPPDDGISTSDVGTTYELLGECYVDGLMHGEASDMSDTHDQDIALL